jgi:hypothetical protein
MNPKYNEQLSAWCEEEISNLKAKGATDDFLTEPAFATLVLTQVLEKHEQEIKADKEFAEAVFMEMVFKKASPTDFRRLAAQDRQKGNHHIAYLFEICADRRERGEI